MLINSRYDVRTIKLKENSNLELFEICSVMTGGIRYHQITLQPSRVRKWEGQVDLGRRAPRRG